MEPKVKLKKNASNHDLQIIMVLLVEETAQSPAHRHSKGRKHTSFVINSGARKRTKTPTTLSR
jgi:hypothetical protein